MRTFRAPKTRPRKLTADEERRARSKMIATLHSHGGYSHDYLAAKTTRELKCLCNRFRPDRGIRPLLGAEISLHAIKLT